MSIKDINFVNKEFGEKQKRCVRNKLVYWNY